MNRFKPGLMTAGMLLAALTFAVQATVSTLMDTDRARVAVASAGTLSNQSSPGLACGSYGFNDTQSGTQIQWLRNGVVISSATAATYTAQPEDVGTSLSMRITPATSAAVTDPSSGAATTSVAAAGVALSVGHFIAPTTTAMSWSAANSYCQVLGARLPSVQELQQLFVDATLPPTWYPDAGYISNSKMCTVHGWPLNGQCGGILSSYWSSSEFSAGTHIFVNLGYGNAGYEVDSSTNQVACVEGFNL